MTIEKMGRLHNRLSLILCVAIVASAPFARSDATIYDNLRQYGLPPGLLPKGITNFTFNPAEGRFQVNLPQPCNAKFENQVHYDFNVTGTISPGRIGDISGVSAQELFLWFPVKGISVDVPSSGLIYFDVGVVDKQFSLSLFENPPDCSAVDPKDPQFNSQLEEVGVLLSKSRSKSGKRENRLRADS